MTEYFLYLNLFVMVTMVGLQCVHLANRKWSLTRYGVELKLHYTFLLACVVAPLFFIGISHEAFDHVIPRLVNIGGSAKVPTVLTFTSGAIHQLAAPPPATSGLLQNILPTLSITWLAIISMIWGLLFLIASVIRVARLLRQTQQLRCISGVQIFVADVSTALSFWFGRPIVVLSTERVVNHTHVAIAVKHELQHHRQGDTKWVYLWEWVRMSCLINPFAFAWHRLLGEVQELSCDEAVIGRSRVSPGIYGRCLWEAASDMRKAGLRFAGTTNMAASPSAKLLQRRILAMKRVDVCRSKHKWLTLGAACLGTAVATSGLLARDVLDQRKISAADVRKVIEIPVNKGRFPIEVNEAIVNQLNRFVNTDGGRAYVERALERKAEIDQVLSGAVENHGVPEELLAVAFVESGFADIVQDHSPYSGGVWQFIPSTARRYGLRVDDEVDERRDIVKATDAALRYLKDNYLVLNDWRLSILSYYLGENRVARQIRNTDTRDPWLIAVSIGDHDYLAKVMAAVLILRDPEAFLSR